MKIFLTGEIQVGKSTVIHKVLSLLNIVPGGFKTNFAPNVDRSSWNESLYINSPSTPPQYLPENTVAEFSTGRPQPCTEKFDTLGVDLIRSARKGSRLILMDECGFLEHKAVLFQQEILKALDDDLPILGVIRLMKQGQGWTEQIINHPQVSLYTVTRENRDELPQIIAAQLETTAH